MAKVMPDEEDRSGKAAAGLSPDEFVKVAETDRQMRIALVRDVLLGRLVNKMLKHSDPAYPWGNTLSILQSADLRICNLECVLSDIGNPWSATPKVFHFRSDEKNIQTLQIAKIYIVSLANNHVLDYEYEALQRMLNILNEQGILHAGAGKDL